jgi:PhzF family phenazine biosynthesis protein
MLTVIHTSVFGTTPEGGNPCPVVLGATELTSDEMQSLAATFGHETCFVLPSTLADCDIRLRYFVPRYEMEMCVHATIAAVTVLAQRQFLPAAFMIQTPLGGIPVAWDQIGEALQVRVEQFAPKFSTDNPNVEQVAAALRVPATAIATDRSPIQSVSVSRAKLIVPLRDYHCLDQLDPDFEHLYALCDRYQTTGFYPFTRQTRSADLQAEARQFPLRAGYPEDPATGVAACALAAYLTHYTSSGHPRDGQYVYQIGQGYAMGRPSLIQAAAQVTANVITKTWVGGTAAIFTETTFPAPLKL